MPFIKMVTADHWSLVMVDSAWGPSLFKNRCIRLCHILQEFFLGKLFDTCGAYGFIWSRIMMMTPMMNRTKRCWTRSITKATKNDDSNMIRGSSFSRSLGVTTLTSLFSSLDSWRSGSEAWPFGWLMKSINKSPLFTPMEPLLLWLLFVSMLVMIFDSDFWFRNKRYFLGNARWKMWDNMDAERSWCEKNNIIWRTHNDWQRAVTSLITDWILKLVKEQEKFGLCRCRCNK